MDELFYLPPNWSLVEGVPWLISKSRRTRGHWESCQFCGRSFPAIHEGGSVVSGMTRNAYCSISCSRRGYHSKRPRKGRQDLFASLTADEAWLTGQIWADGSLDPVGPAALTWNVTTATSDEQMAIEISRIIEEPPRVYKPRERRKQGYAFYLSGSPVQRLVDIGLVHNKTRECTLPTLGDREMPDFIRGFFDGDGSVGLYGSPTRRKDGSLRLTSSFCGTREMMVGVMDVLATSTSITPHIPLPSASIWALRFNHYDSLRLADYMYYPGATCLHRKRDIFDAGRAIAPPREGY